MINKARPLSHNNHNKQSVGRPTAIDRLFRFFGSSRVVVFFALVILVGIATIIWASADRPHPQAQRYWIMSHTVLDKMSANMSARAALANDILYVTGFSPDQTTPAEQGLHIIPTRDFTSETTFARSISSGAIPSYVKAVLYDNEPWQLTPRNERQNVVFYYQRANEIAHAHRLLLIATPVPSSYSVQVAPYADVVDVQAQSEQASVSMYVNHIQSRAQGSRRANPRVVVLSGVSTNPTAGDPTPQQLLDIANATFPNTVQGWWLNIPSPGTACPRCHQPRPDIGISFLSQLGPNRITP
ncbi:MAG TPA: hypothetical protein VGS08_00720 [Candidatus Saccharimonadales bacterium]|nr:hypothetical protein [Candidatus Saccharimonadales bacterium]